MNPADPRTAVEPGLIPFNKPGLAGNELAYVSQAIERGWISGDGEFTKKAQEWLRTKFGVAAALLTTSCTDALEMAALLLDVAPGDEIIVPSFTFVSTANGFVLRGAKPVFADIREDTLNLDERLLGSLITSRTKAVVPVHYAGIGCEMQAILDFAQGRGIHVVEDNAHGLFGRYRGQWLGTFGSIAALSFHETKNINCGEGGALLVNDPALVARAEILRAKGTNRSAFLRGEVDKYTWVDQGSSFLPSDMLAAFLLAQLEGANRILAARRRVWDYYSRELRSWADPAGVRLPDIPEHCEQPFHMFYLLMPSPESRDALIRHLKAERIMAVFHYVPLHLSPMGRRFGGRPGYCPVAESVSSRLVRLPFYNELRNEDLERIVAAVKNFPG